MTWWNPLSWRRDSVPEERQLQSGDARQDGIMNSVMALGTSRDKRWYTSYQACVVTDVEAQELWNGNDLAKKIIEDKTNDAIRAGYDIDVDGDAVAGAELKDAMSKTGPTGGCDAAIRQARHYERAYGGAAIWPVINDGLDPSLPLNEDAISEIENLIVFEPREMVPTRWNVDFFDKRFGLPKAFRLYPIFGNGSITSPIEVHQSRLVMFDGIRHSRRVQNGPRLGFGHSNLTLFNETLKKFDLSFDSINALTADLSQAVLYLEGLADMISDGDEDGIRRKIALIDLMRSTNRLLPLDSKDKYQRVETPLTGVADLLHINMQRVSTAADMPFTRFWGEAAAGLHATGKHDQDNWDDHVDAERVEHLDAPVRQLAYLSMKAKKGPMRGKVPKKWGTEWRDLRQMSDLEKAQAASAQGTADKAWTEAGVYSPEEIAHHRSAGDEFKFGGVLIDVKARAAGDMVVDPPVAPEPTPAELAAQAQLALPPGQPDQAKPGEPSPKAKEAQRAADSLPPSLRYDALDVATAKQSGVMIALFLPTREAGLVAVDADGGISPDDLHVTLAFLGNDLPDVAVQRATGIAYDAAMRWAAPQASLSGVGRFARTQATGGKDVVYASVDSPDVDCLQRHLIGMLDCLNVPASREHGFVPHVTLQYVDPGKKAGVTAVDPLELTFAAIVVAAGAERVVLPFRGDQRPSVCR